MIPIYKNLYQFTVYIPPMDFTIHQYLLASDPAILFAAGTVQQAEAALPEVKAILNGKPLKYIFVSHLESDECGGLSVFLREYPDVVVICSALCARELPGFGYTGMLLPASPASVIRDGELSLRLFDYPSEVHLQNGLICLEENSGIFYSGDLMLRFGNGSGQTVEASWQDQVDAVGEERIPNEGKARQLREALRQIAPSFVAVGHGFCLECGL